MFPVSVKQWEFALTVPLDMLLLRPHRVEVAQLESNRVAERLVQDGLDVDLAREKLRFLIGVEYLPLYCPELNPVEGAWSYVKYGCLANFAAANVDHLYQQTADSLSSLCCNQNLLPAFLEHTKLQL